jgi:hypothetical protein
VMPMPMRQSSLRFERELCAISVWCSETSPGSAGSPRVTCVNGRFPPILPILVPGRQKALRA